MKAIRDASPQARHDFTRLDQVNQFEFGQRTGVQLKFRLKAKRALSRLKCPDELYKSQNEH